MTQGFFDELCDMFGLKNNDFWATYHGRKCEPQTLAYSLPHAAWVSINFRCHGGGGKKVIKTIVKSRSTEKTVDADRSVYEQAFVNALEQEIPFYALRHQVKPGITGWAQICFPYGASSEDARQKLQYDLYYLKNYSLFLDLSILCLTLQVVLWGKGAR